MLDLDVESQELVFKADLKSNKWLAIGLAQDMLDADVIYWEAGRSGYDLNGEKSTLSVSDQISLRQESKVYDRIAVHGVLFDNPDNQLRNVC